MEKEWAAKVRSGHLALALVTDRDLVQIARGLSKELNNISPESLGKKLSEICAGSAEENLGARRAHHLVYFASYPPMVGTALVPRALRVRAREPRLCPACLS